MTDCEPVNVSKVYTDMKENIRHVTIRQIIGAEQMHKTAPLLIEGSEASSVRYSGLANPFYAESSGQAHCGGQYM